VSSTLSATYQLVHFWLGQLPLEPAKPGRTIAMTTVELTKTGADAPSQGRALALAGTCTYAKKPSGDAMYSSQSQPKQTMTVGLTATSRGLSSMPQNGHTPFFPKHSDVFILFPGIPRATEIADLV